MSDVPVNQTVVAMFDWPAGGEWQIPLVQGENYLILQHAEQGWDLGRDKHGNEGFFPSSFVSVVSTPEPSQSLQQNEKPPAVSPPPTSASTTTAVTSSSPPDSSNDSNSEKKSIEKSSRDSSSYGSGSDRRKQRRRSRSRRRSSNKDGDDSNGSGGSGSKKKKVPRASSSLVRLQSFETSTRENDRRWSLLILGDQKTTAIATGQLIPEAVTLTISRLEATLKSVAVASDQQTVLAFLSELKQINESYDWSINEFQKQFQQIAQSKLESIAAYINSTHSSLQSLVELQQARVFYGPENLSDKIQEELKRVETLSLSNRPCSSPLSASSKDPLDAAVRWHRKALAGYRKEFDTISKRATFLSSIVSESNVFTCFLVMNSILSTVLALAVQKEQVYSPPNQKIQLPPSQLEQVYEKILEVNLSFVGMPVTLGALLVKAANAWGAFSSVTIDGSSISQEFSNEISHMFVKSYRSIICEMTIEGACLFAKAAVIRMLWLTYYRLIDLTRDPAPQFISKIGLSVQPTQANSPSPTLEFVSDSSSISLLLPPFIPTRGQEQHLVAQSQTRHGVEPAFTKSQSTGTAPTHWNEAFLFQFSGWEIPQQAGKRSVKLINYSCSVSPEIPSRFVCHGMLDFLTELGWIECTDEFLLQTSKDQQSLQLPSDQSSSSSAVGNAAATNSSSGSDINELKVQLEAERKLRQEADIQIAQLSLLVEQLSGSIRTIQSQLPSIQHDVDNEKAERRAIEMRLSQLLSAHDRFDGRLLALNEQHKKLQENQHQVYAQQQQQRMETLPVQLMPAVASAPIMINRSSPIVPQYVQTSSAELPQMEIVMPVDSVGNSNVGKLPVRASAPNSPAPTPSSMLVSPPRSGSGSASPVSASGSNTPRSDSEKDPFSAQPKVLSASIEHKNSPLRPPEDLELYSDGGISDSSEGTEPFDD